MFFLKLRAVFRTACLISVVGLSATGAAAEGASDRTMKATTVSGFNWLANGSQDASRKVLVRRAARRASMQSIKGGATWICTPAGFGRKSRCHRG